MPKTQKYAHIEFLEVFHPSQTALASWQSGERHLEKKLE